jgi:two-component system chemotaxis sensor kinase CheA
MSTRDDEFLRRLQAAFEVEAQEHLQAMSAGFLQLEKVPDAEEQQALVEEVFREAHSLKGAARAVNLLEIESVCQALESVLAAWKQKKLQTSAQLFDVLNNTLDMIERFLGAGVEERPAIAQTMPQIVRQLQRAQSGDSTLNGNAAQHADATLTADTTQNVGTALAADTALSDYGTAAISGGLNAIARNGVAGAPLGTFNEHSSVAMSEIAEQSQFETATAPVLNNARDAAPTHNATSTPAPAIHAQSPASAPTANGVQRRDSGPSEVKARPAATETIRIATSTLDSLFLQVEELLSIKLTTAQRVKDLQELKTLLSSFDKSLNHEQVPPATSLLTAPRNSLDGNTRSIAVEAVAQRPIALVENPDESDAISTTRDMMRLLNKRVATLARVAKQDSRSVNGMVDSLLEDVKKVLMQPFGSLLDIFPKVVRDLSRSQGKEVQLVLQGGEVEIDRRILEEMKDPLLHLVRNAIDHGLETADQRERQGKLRQSTVSITVATGGDSKVRITMHDDGQGIDIEKVKVSAQELGHTTAEHSAEMTDAAASMLIFHSGLSTRSTVTDLSGRGLGMAIVRQKVEKLGGHISVESRLHHGTTFHITLPLTLATFRGILVEVAQRQFVIPTLNVQRVLRLRQDTIKTVGGKETILFDGTVTPLVPLHAVLEIPSPKRGESPLGGGAYLTALVLSMGDATVAFRVDRVLNEQEVLVKSLGQQLLRVRNVAGATVLGSGKVVPILNPQDLVQSVQSARMNAPHATIFAEPDGRAEESPRNAILIAEDSITSRMLLKNVLESAGYSVRTTVDGSEAFAALKAGHYDLLISDVEMPNLNGFELTAQVRADPQLANLPVILVTSLGSREHQEQGLDAGATAYVVKSGFDQENLLATVRRLL